MIFCTIIRGGAAKPRATSNPTIEDIVGGARQLVAGDGYTVWAWSLVPLKSGQQTLYLSVGTRFNLPNNNEETQFTPLYEKSIGVQVDRIYETRHFVSSNWQWLTATLIIPLVGFCLALETQTEAEQLANSVRCIDPGSGV